MAVALICTVSEIHSVLMLARSPKSLSSPRRLPSSRKLVSSHKPSNALELSNNSLAVLRRYPLRAGAGFKRTGDILFAFTLLSIGLPLILAISLLVKFTSRGPVFYTQERIGRRYRRFGCIKFRTMQVDADKRLKALLDSSEMLKQEFARDHKLKNDPRITPIGLFLRTTSLDELPQLLNILLGEMSVVGPRPIVQDEIRRYGSAMNEVLSVRPGLTGLWQVSGRNNLTYKRRVQLDLNYVRRHTLLIDFQIILRTVGVVLFPSDKGAY